MTTLKKIITLIFVLLLLLVAIAVSSLNAEAVSLNLHWYQLNWPLGFTLLLFSSLGVVFGLVMGWLFWTWPANKQKIYWKRAYFKLKQEHDQLTEKEQKQITQTSTEGQVKIP
ncbi:LapA family protein [Marinicella litoralis]|uniref:Uncharacterized protein DUF1049 n=1 Tax=Marinicella litoralis TaxID=644220 RepID=A0A4R6XQG4_9GAMM|nr:LapA family protein [Marinicella litoralis]TDR18498.1 uncharacterized protein DUF1049 [Marinicella litoralis]